jgi:hypothetical protein
MTGPLARVLIFFLTAAIVLIAGAATAQMESEQPARGKLEVRASETGARVFIDGKLMGSTPLPGPVDLVEGEHVVVIDKPGFQRFQKVVAIVAGETRELQAQLPIENTGRLRVTVAGEERMRVIVDGKDVGETPFEGELPVGAHEVSGRSTAARASATTVEIVAGETISVELSPVRFGTLEVRVDGDGGTIAIDGEEVGQGRHRVELPEGAHAIRVTREGYVPFEKPVEVVAGDVHVETVTLRKLAAGQIEGQAEDAAWSFDGVYGGLVLMGMFEPTGAGTSLDTSCDALGATLCETSTPMGGAFGGYLGYAFAPVGLELLILGGGDVHEPVAVFDGNTGSEINPLVATPARDERFIIGRFGGGAAVRLRLIHPIDRFRITGAIGAGAAYRRMLIGRDTESVEGHTSSVTPEGAGYLSAVLSLELAGQLVLTGSTALALGLAMWLEHAGSDTTSEFQSDTYLTGGDGRPRPQATPAYDLASGTQFFLGPFLGFHFGP